MTLAIIDARGPQYVVVAAGAELAGALAFQAEGFANAAEASAAAAQALVGPVYADTTAGLAATAANGFFAVNASGIVTIYQDVAGVAVAQRTLPTSATLAASGGSALVGFSQSTSYGNGTVGKHLKAFVCVTDAPYNATGNGTTDDSAAVQAAYDAVVAAGGGSIYYPTGTYKQSLNMTSRNVSIAGSGRGGTTLRPLSTTAPALRAIYRLGGWDFVTVRDLSVIGDPARTRTDIGFQSGANTYVNDDEYSGATYFLNVQFSNLDKCLYRPFGSIGLWTENCHYTNINYPFWSRGITAGQFVGSDAMHAGVLHSFNDHFDTFYKALCYLDSPTNDTGQITFTHPTIDAAEGFVFYFKQVNGAGSVPAVIIRDMWNEPDATATGASVVVEGAPAQQARFLYAKDCNLPIHFENCALGSFELIGSSVYTKNCSLNECTTLIADSHSSLVHERARSFNTNPLGTCLSLAMTQQSADQITNPHFQMPHKTAFSSRKAALMAHDGTAVVAWTGSVGRSSVLAVNDGVLPGVRSAQDITINVGDTLFPPLINTSANVYVVWIYTYKKISGGTVTMQVNQGAGMSNGYVLTSADWVTLCGISRRTASQTGIGFNHSVTGSTAVIRHGGLALLEFTKLQDALDYINAGVFPYVADSGFTAGTGTANKGAFAAYAGANVSAAYVEAEAQATDDAAKNASQRVLALEQKLREKGVI